MLRYITFICTFLLISQHAFSQERGYKKFQFDFRIGYDIPTQASTNSGLAYGFEPKFYFNNSISIGFKMDYSRFGSDIADIGINEFGSYVLTADYFSKSDNSVRLFGGLGGGLFHSGYFFTPSQRETNFGIFSRIGMEVKKFRISLEYNYILSDESFSTPNYYGVHLSSNIF